MTSNPYLYIPEVYLIKEKTRRKKHNPRKLSLVWTETFKVWTSLWLLDSELSYTIVLITVVAAFYFLSLEQPKAKHQGS